MFREKELVNRVNVAVEVDWTMLDTNELWLLYRQGC